MGDLKRLLLKNARLIATNPPGLLDAQCLPFDQVLLILNPKQG